MKIILLRHGNRDLMTSSDGGLNQVGKEFAAGLYSRLSPKGSLLVPTKLVASPKKRAQETLLPLSLEINLPLHTEPALDERKNSETSADFRARVRNFLDSVPAKFNSSDVVYFCTHADWLEDAMAVINSDIPSRVSECGFVCGEMRTFELKDDLWVYLR